MVSHSLFLHCMYFICSLAHFIEFGYSDNLHLLYLYHIFLHLESIISFYQYIPHNYYYYLIILLIYLWFYEKDRLQILFYQYDINYTYIPKK